MSQIIPTVTVVHPDVPGATMIINESDFDPAVHTRPEDAAGQPAELTLEEMKRPQLVEVAARYNVTLLPGMSNAQAVEAIKAAAGYQQQPASEPTGN